MCARSPWTLACKWSVNHVALGAFERVLEQASDRHRPDASGNRRDRASHFRCRIEVHIADEPTLAAFALDPVDADVDDDCAGFDPVALDEFRSPDRCDDEIGAPRYFSQIARPRVSNGDGAVSLQEQLRHRLTDNVRASNHDRIEARQVTAQAIDEDEAAGRRAGHEGPFSDRKSSNIDRMKPVNVFVRVDRVDHLLRIDMLWQRELDEDAVAMLRQQMEAMQAQLDAIATKS